MRQYRMPVFIFWVMACTTPPRWKMINMQPMVEISKNLEDPSDS